jgi:copper chaperone
MKTILFETNLHCGNCVRSIKGFLSDIPELTSWEVDLEHPKKMITAHGNDELTASKIIEAIDGAGFEAKEVVPSNN